MLYNCSIVSDLTLVSLDTFPVELEGAGGKLIEGEALRTTRNLAIAQVLCGKSVSVIKLPNVLAVNLESALVQVGNVPSANCSFFAFALLGLPHNVPDGNISSRRLEGWDLKPVESDHLGEVEPGSCLLYGDIVGEDFTGKHWAVACGYNRVIQVFGLGGMMAITPSDAPATLYGTSTVLEAKPHSSAN